MGAVRNTGLFVVGELINKLFPFALIPILTNHFGAEVYGDYQVQVSAIVVFSVLINFGMEIAISRYFYFKGKRFIPNLLLNYYIFTIFIVIVVSILSGSLIVTFVLISSQLQGVLNALYSYFIISRKVKSYVTVQFTQGVVYFGLIYTLVNITKLDILGVIFTFSFANFLAIIIGWRFIRIDLKQKVSLNKSKLRKSVCYVSGYGKTVVIHQLAQISKGHIDKFFLALMISSRELGIYSVAFQFSFILQVILMSVNKATLPFFYAYVREERSPIHIILLSLFSLILVPIVYLFVSFVPADLYALFLGEEFSNINDYLIPIICGVAVNLPYMILGNYLFAHNRNAAMAVMSVINAVVYLVLMSGFELLGIMGFQFALVISNIILISMMVIYIWLKLIKNESNS